MVNWFFYLSDFNASIKIPFASDFAFILLFSSHSLALLISLLNSVMYTPTISATSAHFLAHTLPHCRRRDTSNRSIKSYKGLGVFIHTKMSRREAAEQQLKNDDTTSGSLVCLISTLRTDTSFFRFLWLPSTLCLLLRWNCSCAYVTKFQECQIPSAHKQQQNKKILRLKPNHR